MRRVRLLLINLWIPEQHDPRSPFSSMIPSVGLALLAGSVRDLAEVSVSDENLDGLNCFLDRTDWADVIGIYCTTFNFKRCLRIGKQLRKMGYEGVLLAGGPHVTICPEDWPILQEYYDAVVKGHAEGRLPSLLAKAWHGRSGVAALGCIIGEEDLSVIPDTISSHYARYAAINGVFPLETSRGCRGMCAFCANSYENKKLRPVCLPRTLSELKLASEISSVRHISVVDDLPFFIFEERNSVLGALANSGLTWDINLRAEDVVPTRIKTLAESGCTELTIGIESTDSGERSTMGKSRLKQTLGEMVRRIQDNGIALVNLNLIVGLPGCSIGTVNGTLEAALSSGARVFANILKPLPGTRLWHERKRYGLSINDRWYMDDWFLQIDQHYLDRYPAFSTNEMTSEDIWSLWQSVFTILYENHAGMPR